MGSYWELTSSDSLVTTRWTLFNINVTTDNMIYYYHPSRERLLAQLKEWKISTEHYRKELTKLIEEKNYYESDTQKVSLRVY